MKKISLLIILLFSMILISACAKQQPNNNLIGQGSDVPQETSTETQATGTEPATALDS